MTAPRRLVVSQIQYPFVVLPLSVGWEVLFVGADRPFREALFDSREEAYAFAESQNGCWRDSRKLMYSLIQRATDSARSYELRGAQNLTDFERLLRMGIIWVSTVNKGFIFVFPP